MEVPDSEKGLIEFRIPEAQQKALLEALNPDQLRRAEFNVIKNTTKAVAGIVRKKVRSLSTIDVKYVNRVIVVRNPTGDPPVGIITIRKIGVPLIDFKHRFTKKRGLGVTFLKSGEEKTFHHAFKANVKAISAGGDVSIHEGMFMRMRHLPTSGPNANALNKHKNPKFKLTRAGFAGRLSIKQMVGPSIYHLVSIPGVLNSIVFDSAKYMATQASSQISRFINQKPIDDSE